jgi:TRAP-type C4-dicarboxylate transport system permease small subunit
MNIFEKFLRLVDATLKQVCVLMMALLVIDVTWQVVTRFILPEPSTFTEEVARFLLIWISLLGGAYVYREHGHLGFDLLAKKLSIKQSTKLFQLCSALVAIFAVTVLIIGGGNLVFLTWSLGQLSAVLNIPMAFIYMVIPLSGLIFLLYSIYFMIMASSTNPVLAVNIEEKLSGATND